MLDAPIFLSEKFKETENQWNWLYKIGGCCALIMFVLIPIQIAIFIISPPPQTVINYFNLFQHNYLLGLLDLDFLLIIDNLLSIPIYLALYMALRRKSAALMILATLSGLISIILFLVSREATFSMGSLSNQYAVARKNNSCW